MHITSIFLITCYAGIAASSCGGLTTKTKSPRDTSEAVQLIGTWKTDCLGSDPLALAGSARIAFDFGISGSFEHDLTAYDEADCRRESRSISRIVTGTHALAGKAAGIDGARQLNLTVQEVRVIPHTVDSADALNRRSYCGIVNWQSAQERVVTAVDCDGFRLDKGKTYFDIMRRSGDQLTVGSPSGTDLAESEDQRPAALSLGEVFKAEH